MFAHMDFYYNSEIITAPYSLFDVSCVNRFLDIISTSMDKFYCILD